MIVVGQNYKDSINMKPLFNKPQPNFIQTEHNNSSSSFKISYWLPNRFLDFHETFFYVYDGEKSEHYFKSKQYIKERFEFEFEELLINNGLKRLNVHKTK